MLISDLLSELHQRLGDVSDTPGLDAQVLTAHVLGKSRTWVLAHPEVEVLPQHQAQLTDALYRLESGEPLPYVLGHWEFFGLDFSVTPDVLIPRPETEILVEQALDWLKNHPGERTAADVGTGSGCIAVALAVDAPLLSLHASDISLPALQVARANAERHRVLDRIQFILSDLLPPGEQMYDLICANLPYIPESTLRSLKVYRSEPTLALSGGNSGLDVIRRLLVEAPSCLQSPGLLLLEIESTQAEAVLELSRIAFPNAHLRLIQDLSGRDRVISIEILSV